MNIGIFDTAHFETAYTLVRLFDVPGNSITVYTNRQCFKMFKELFEDKTEQYHWEIQEPEESHAAFIRKMNKVVRQNKTELFFYSTISNNHLLHALMLKCNPRMRSILTIHAINSLFSPGFHANFKSIVRNTGKKMLLKEIKEYNVISETMLAYMMEKAGSGKKIHNIPGAVFEKETPPLQIRDRMKIVIPGSIDRKRRDYSEVFELLILSENANFPLDIVLLGAPAGAYGRQIIENLKRLETSSTAFKFYETIVEQQEFDTQMANANFVFIPCTIESNQPDGAKEIYGLTMSSGSIGDVTRFAKPYIIPSRLCVPQNMEESAFRYNDVQQVFSFLQTIFHHPQQYAAWQEKALSSSRNYTIDKIRSLHPDLF